jgi:hypothetical protein
MGGAGGYPTGSHTGTGTGYSMVYVPQGQITHVPTTKVENLIQLLLYLFIGPSSSSEEEDKYNFFLQIFLYILHTFHIHGK